MAHSGWAVRTFLRLLPADFRERVAEPALYDLIAANADAKRLGVRQRLAALAWAFECLRLVSPRLIWRRGLTRFGATLLIVALIVLVLIQRASYGHVVAAG